MMSCRPVLAALLVAGVLAAEVRAELVPLPRAYYNFENITGGNVFRNEVTPGVLDGYLGMSPSDTVRNPQIVPGLFGSGQALRFTSNQIARIPTLVTDTNGDRIDEDVFSGAFTVFARVDTPNVAQMNVVNADRGPLTEPPARPRGWYMDFSNSTQNPSGEYLLRPRFTTGGGPYLHPTGTETTNYKNVDSIGIVWLPDPNPGGTNEGWMGIYINGLLLASQTHNWASVYVGEAGFNIGYGELVSWGNGITIDDVAVWDVALTAPQMLAVHTQGVPVPEPGTWVLLAAGAACLFSWGLRRRTWQRNGPIVK